ncbi:MAG: ABC transporter permease [Roseobacter sp. MedPE-SWde]|uniref:ABC transporter permease n=1 Tax=Roseobacter sp. MED193 TaxID=314262 RepID=UPI000068BA15|nr:ABC transporter permease [Roseobacter sp. MED193]EAQ43463.1 peptide/nickel/opine uptake family ABC transporter, permease protein [Roseobacter sp. MED193]OIQ42401.1 MAG: ABC transporter permease [Roseobacter sp. MedPE-SWde]
MKNIPISAMIGLFFTALYFLAALFAPLIAPYGMAEVVGDVWETSRIEIMLGIAPDGVTEANYWLGTDNIGRDLLSRMIYGGRTTIFIATAATILSFTLGSVLGFFAAVAGGWVDQVLSRFVDLVMSIPTLIFALVVLSVMPVTVPVLILVMGLLDSTRVYRLARAVAVDIEVMDYVEAARLRGEKTAWIIFREILPNALSPLVAEMGLRFIFMVLFVSTLSFLGLGIQPPEADWGGIVKENKDGIVYGIPAALMPAFAIATLAISVNLVADWVLNRTTSLKGGRG